ncbi:helix-turn-helix domain-containing protein [Enterococcus innesii]|uniref:helix-turn-helix domain-containing protein n=1 Tax=Enterococcus innesii TaxID=2839759 RepID=UPI0034A4177C
MKFTSLKDFRGVSNSHIVDLVMGEDLEFTWHLKERLDERKMSGRKLARITGIRPALVAEYANNSAKANTVNIEHIFAMMIALRITDVEELFTISMPQETEKRFSKERKQWLETLKMPDQLAEIEQKNKA